MQRRRLRALDSRQRRYEHRFWIMERRWGIEHERNVIALLGRKRRDVLELRRVEGVEDARDIHHRSDVRAVETVAGLRREAELHGEIACRAGGEGFNDGHAVAVVE